MSVSFRVVRGHRAGFGAGAVAGAAVTAGALLGRQAVIRTRQSRGHPLKHRLLDLGSALLQRKLPLDAMSTYLNGFHFYADDLGRQVEASHFCVHLRPDLHQCVIFDKNAPDARLIGIEYIISRDRYRQLPEEEQRLWHSHHYEVKSGILVAPGVPEIAERSYFEDLVTTYGKTFHTWQYDRDDFPYGIPQLMMAFTADGQADPSQVAARDQALGVSTARNKSKRESIPMPEVQPEANSWQSGTTVQTRLAELPFRH